MMAKKKTSHPFLKLLCFIYCGFMAYLLFFRAWRYVPELSYWEQVMANMERQPFRTIQNFIAVIQVGPSHQDYRLCLTNMVGNTALFVPAGLLFPKLFRKWRPFWRFFLHAVCLIALVEVVQLFSLLGIFDVDDIILNVLGMSFGYFLYFLFMRKE